MRLQLLGLWAAVMPAFYLVVCLQNLQYYTPLLCKENNSDIEQFLLRPVNRLL
eukprot:Gb_18203 [translate_table: standard]